MIEDYVTLCESEFLILNARIADDRIKAAKYYDKYDVNVSSIGHYPFKTMHPNAGIKMNGNWTSGSGELFFQLIANDSLKIVFKSIPLF